MVKHDNVKNHTLQHETSHSRRSHHENRNLGMDESDIFRRNLLAAMKEEGLQAAELSRLAGLNTRAVKDIEEGRSKSPKISTVFALAGALGRDPGEMMGLGSRAAVQSDLAAFLAQYDEEEQLDILNAIRRFPGQPREK